MTKNLISKLIHQVEPYAQFSLKNSGNIKFAMSSENCLEGVVDAKRQIERLDTESLQDLFDSLRNFDFENFKFERYIFTSHERYLTVMKRCRSVINNLVMTELLKRKEAEAGVSC